MHTLSPSPLRQVHATALSYGCSLTNALYDRSWSGPDPDALYERARAAGLEITREIEDTDYASRTFTVVDPWSVTWSFGTYPGS